jgi:uncharacterized membrane-anchored protein
VQFAPITKKEFDMDLVWLVYLISLLTPIGTFLTMLTVVGVITMIVLLVYRGAECDQRSYYNEKANKEQAEKAKWAMGHVKTAMMVVIPSMIFLTLLPTQKTAYMMVGAYAAQKVAENGKVQETGGKVLALINQKLDQYLDDGIKELQDKAEKEVEKASRKERK